MSVLWHFTCDHGRVGIEQDGHLRPHRHPWLPEPLIWLTDLDVPFREGLGLTSHILSCDRTAHRFKVVTDGAIWWPTYARRITPRAIVEQLNGTPGAWPAHWWVSTEPLPASAA